MHEKYEYEKKCFKENIENHQMEVILDQGVYRHIKFKSPDNNSYWFDLVTWPGFLCISGDMGCYTFSNSQDMFEFFKGDKINPGYWGKRIKVGTLQPSKTCMEWSEKELEKSIRERLCNAVGDLSLTNAKQLVKQVRRDILTCYDEYSLFKAVTKFKLHSRLSDLLDLTDLSPSEYTDFKYDYLWCCYAIVWGIQQYDNFKSEVTHA